MKYDEILYVNIILYIVSKHFARKYTYIFGVYDQTKY